MRDTSTAHHRLWLASGALLMGVGAMLAGSGVAAAEGDSRDQNASSSSQVDRTASPRDNIRRPAERSTGQPGTARSAASSATELPSFTSTRTTPLRGPSAAAPAPAPTQGATYTVANPLPPRLQWLANDGYCGEESFVSAGLYYGQYISQYDARALAGKNAPQNTTASQLLLGVNDVAAAKAMHLTATAFNTAAQTDTSSFLKWVKGNVAAGYPVAIGVYTNEFRFYGRTNPLAGDPDYDHIVTVTGVSSKLPLTGPVAYYADDVLTFSDHGLWTGTPTGLPQYLFSYAFGAFPASRRQANAARGAVYSLPIGRNYGIAITGIADLKRETVPVRLTTSVNSETPAMVNGSTARPAAKPVTLTITLSNLTPGKAYNLYRYNTMAAVPESSFNAAAAKAAQKWTIVATGATYTMTQTIMSNEIAVYRPVPVTAG